MPTVVIADDSPTLRRIVTSVLSREGFEVVPAEDGVSAVQQVFACMPDAVVLDVQMPRVSGYVAARLLKDDWQTAGIPVILLTSLDAASDRYWGAQTGADRYLTKDFEAPQLVAAVREVIEKASVGFGGREQRFVKLFGPHLPEVEMAEQRFLAQCGVVTLVLRAGFAR